MIVAVTGSSGLIGSALVARLRELGHEVRRVVRGGAQGGAGETVVQWDPEAGTIDAAALEGVDGVVHLAGESIAGGRWSDDKRRRILESRTAGTTLVATTLAALDPKPSVLLSGSAIGFYGDRGDEELTEASSRGDGFLADVVVAWEASAAAAVEAGIRTAFLRSGIVLAGDGGALAPQLPLFKMGLGGKLGSGRQWQSWIALPDEVDAIVHLLTADVAGPVNLTAPAPVTNADFTDALGRALGRPTFLTIPRFGPRLALGRDLADELLFASQRVLPERLLASGYRFTHTDLQRAFLAVLRRP